MSNYAVLEISGKQYKVTPNKAIEVDLLNEENKKVEAQVLIMSENGKITVGTPYLKDKLSLDYIETIKGEKIRVAKFHAKANFRKVNGHRTKKTRLVWTVKS